MIQCQGTTPNYGDPTRDMMPCLFKSAKPKGRRVREKYASLPSHALNSLSRWIQWKERELCR